MKVSYGIFKRCLLLHQSKKYKVIDNYYDTNPESEPYAFLQFVRVLPKRIEFTSDPSSSSIFSDPKPNDDVSTNVNIPYLNKRSNTITLETQ